jgi:hypothetical protein
MTIDEAVKQIPARWRMRLTNWETPDESGWGAELYHKDGRKVVGDKDQPEAAIISAIRQIKP